MPGDKKFELGDYVEVKDRIKLFYELFAGGRLVTSKVKMLTAPDGTQRVIVTAKAYRTPDDPLPGVGTSWLMLPGSTPYTRGSEVENAETSAWGRAIAATGILIDQSIASSQEVQNKAGEPAIPPPPEDHVEPDNGSLIGTAEVGKVGSGADFELRQSPEGPVAAFRLKQGRTGYKVIAHGSLAVALSAIRPEGQRVSVWGSMQDETFAKGGKDITFQVVNLERIKGDDFDLPAPDEATPEPIWPDADEEAAILARELEESRRADDAAERLGEAKDAAGFPG